MCDAVANVASTLLSSSKCSESPCRAHFHRAEIDFLTVPVKVENLGSWDDETDQDKPAVDDD